MEIINLFKSDREIAAEKEAAAAEKAANKKVVVITITFSCLLVLAMILMASPKIIKNFNSVEKYRVEKQKLIEICLEDNLPNKYYCVENKDYLIEIFPIGKTDSEKYPVEDNDRIVKTTWYDSNRTEVVDESYQLMCRD